MLVTCHLYPQTGFTGRLKTWQPEMQQAEARFCHVTQQCKGTRGTDGLALEQRQRPDCHPGCWHRGWGGSGMKGVRVSSECSLCPRGPIPSGATETPLSCKGDGARSFQMVLGEPHLHEWRQGSSCPKGSPGGPWDDCSGI